MTPPQHTNYRRAVLFDAAGTLIELRESVGETYSRTAREFGVQQSAAQLDAAFRSVFSQAPPMAFPEVDRTQTPALERAWWRRCVEQTFERCDDPTGNADFGPRFEPFFDRLFARLGEPSAWRAIEGAHELLRALRSRDLGVAIVSNFDFRLPAILDGLGITPLINLLVLPSDVGAAKPDPAMFERAIADLKVSSSATMVIGDHPEHDVAAARKAGLRAVDVGSLATLGDLLQIIDAWAQD